MLACGLMGHLCEYLHRFGIAGVGIAPQRRIVVAGVGKLVGRAHIVLLPGGKAAVKNHFLRLQAGVFFQHTAARGGAGITFFVVYPEPQPGINRTAARFGKESPYRFIFQVIFSPVIQHYAPCPASISQICEEISAVGSLVGRRAVHYFYRTAAGGNFIPVLFPVLGNPCAIVTRGQKQGRQSHQEEFLHILLNRLSKCFCKYR